MKKIFTFDDFMVAFIAALGYGFGETIARLSGWPSIMCVAASIVLGIALEEFITKIVFSKAVQKSTMNRVFTYVAILLVFLAGQYVSIRWMGVSMLEYLQEEFAFVVGLPILGLIVNLLIRRYRIRKIRKRYGDGSEGFVFDVKKEDIEETNKRNQPIPGGYDADCAVNTRTGIFVGEKTRKQLPILESPMQNRQLANADGKHPNRFPRRSLYLKQNTLGPQLYKSSTKAR